ncbi:MAG: M13 family metallopeptidase [Acidobacteriaceae bacterium]
MLFPISDMKKLLACLIAAASLVLMGQTPPPSKPGAPPVEAPGAAQPRVEPALPYTPSLDVHSMDRGIDPCNDFYEYSCAGWKKNNPIPADQTSWSVYGKLYLDNLTYLRGILEDAAAAKQRDAVDQKIGDYYAACTDTAAIDRAGVNPIAPELKSIAELQSIGEMAPLLARLHLETESNGMLFGAGSQQDPDDSNRVIAAIGQGGLGLPDRDYYFKEDPKSKEIREHYVQHVERVFELLGDPSDQAHQEAETVMRMETELAKSHWTRVEERDPYKLKNKMGLPELQKMAPSLDWTAYFKAANAPQFETVNISTPQFVREMNSELTSVPLADWKAYLRFHLTNSWSPYLGTPFVDENFAFYRAYLRGAKEQQPRWRKCVQWTDQQLGEALGQAYVAKAFSPALKADTVDMTERIEKAMQMRIQDLAWMSPATKQQALVKLHAIRNKVGYPDKWRDYASVNITRGNFADDVRNANNFESHRDFNKIGRPVDRNEWGMTPPTVNAYYNPQMNDINFPAGVLQPPLYDAKIDAAPNYGNTGSTIGHELTHGFDDEGRQFDAHGNLKDWWTKQDAAEFTKRADCVVDQYAQYVVVDNIHINSKLTEGEDVADLGGTVLAYMAWKDATSGKQLQDREGLTPDQRFFVGLAQWACENDRPEEQRLRAATDPHSPGRYRINGVVVNMPQFARAFACKPGSAMVKPADKVCRIW